MKTMTRLLVLAVVAVFVFTACQPGAFTPFIGGSQEAEDTLITETNTDVAGAEPTNAPFQYNGPPTATPYDATDEQRIVLEFDDGVVDVNDDGSIPGLTVSALADTANADGLYDPTGTIGYSATVVPNGNGNSTVTLTMDLSGSTVSTVLEVKMDPTTLTAYSGAKLLNQDGDEVPGESPDDAAYLYPAVPNAPVAAAGAQRNPRAGINLGFPANAPAAGSADFPTVSPGGTPGDFTKSSLSAGISVWELGSDLAWSEVNVSYAYDAGGNLTISLPENAENGDIYQVRHNQYNIASSETIAGFVQRESTDQSADVQKSNLLVVGTTGSITAATDDNGADPPVSINVVFSGTGDIVTSTLSNDSVRIIYDEDNNGQDERVIAWDYFVVTDADDGDNEIAFVLPSDFDPDDGVDPDGWEVQVYPAVLDDNATPDDADDDFPIIDTGAQEFGAYSETGEF